ncbi:MAG: HAMP domain-containing histidine kinase, partial [Syntrophobacteraceae bacterium]|nr:HAMP domain-containing histidine kinase [Syntrophobacteraceae bacterium]
IQSIRDISDRKQAERELSQDRDHLEDLVAERTAELAEANERLKLEAQERRRAKEALKLFAYSVAHDLKSPAIGIYGLTRRLSKQAKDLLDEKSRGYCDQILRASEHIAALVEKINVYIATKEARLSIERINVKEIFQMLREEFSAQLSLRNIEWAEPEEALEIRADRLSVLRVFRNLLDNSLKYGGKQLSKIWIEYEHLEDFHVLSVCDNGKGLGGEDAERIFQPFARNESSRGIEGTGLGLTIVKEIVEKHGGRVWVKPLTKKGAAFYVSISKEL